MRASFLRFICLGAVLALCIPMVACDMQLGGLIGELLEEGIQPEQNVIVESLSEVSPQEPIETIFNETIYNEPGFDESVQDPEPETFIESEPFVEPETIPEDLVFPDYNPAENVINIGSAQELIDWANTIIEEQTTYVDVTINFYNDIDLTGYSWTPIDGAYLKNVTFEGNGHTIYNMTIEGNDNIEPDAAHGYTFGIGFLRSAEYPLTFCNLTFDSADITAWERQAGVIIGQIYSNTDVSFMNVHVTNSRINGWMEYLDQETHSVCFRVGGFIGGTFGGGSLSFESCSVSNTQFNGFHNIAGFVGYDGTGVLTASCFANCSVDEVTITFSYCQANSYSIDTPRKFVSVFFNANDWVDNIDEFEATDNSYSGVTYIDYTTGQSYNPDNFRSWTYEQAHP